VIPSILKTQMTRSYMSLHDWTKTHSSEGVARIKNYGNKMAEFIMAAEEALALGGEITGRLTDARAPAQTAFFFMWEKAELPGTKALAEAHGRAANEWVYAVEKLLSGGQDQLVTWRLSSSNHPVSPTFQFEEVGGTHSIHTVRDFPLARWWGTDRHAVGGTPIDAPGLIDHTKPEILEIGPADLPMDTMARLMRTQDKLCIIQAKVAGTVTIHDNAVGGSDAWYTRAGGNLWMKRIKMAAADRAMNKGESRRYQPEGIQNLFYTDCPVDGGWDAETDLTAPSMAWDKVNREWVSQTILAKWGLHNYMMGGKPDVPLDSDPFPGFGFVFEGPSNEWQGNIRDEHHAYPHFCMAPGMLFRNQKVHWTGRTGNQLVNRPQEGPPGLIADGNYFIQDSHYEDCCKENQGGGSALTVKGHPGLYALKNVKVRDGCTPGLHSRVLGNITGCFVCESYAGVPCEKVWIDGCSFLVGQVYPGKGQARRPNVVFEDFRYGALMNTQIRQFVGADPTALKIMTPSLVLMYLDPTNDVRGDCWFDLNRYRDPSLDGSGYLAMLDALSKDKRFVITTTLPSP
jgi:hypothetical protein